MVVVMQKGCSREQIEGVQWHLRDRGLQAQLNEGTERVVIGVLGQTYPELQDELELLSGVGEVIPVSKPYKLASREFAAEETVIKIGDTGVAIGGDNFVVFAGPCAVESEDQVTSTAQEVKKAGADVLRGGAFKPRSSPYSFRGLGEDGLKILASAREATGLPFITEVMAPHDVELVSRYADILQIGARNMQNFTLLDEIGKADDGEARLVRDLRGLAPGRRVRHGRWEQAGHTLRTRHTDLRDLHSQYDGPQRRPRDQETQPLAGRRGPQSRDGTVVSGYATGPSGGGGWGPRPYHRGASEPGCREMRRLSIADL